MALYKARQYLDSGANYNRIPHEIRIGMLWAMDFWLRTHDYEPDLGNGWRSLRNQFLILAKDDPALDLAVCAEFAECLETRLWGWRWGLDPEFVVEPWDQDTWARKAHEYLERAERVLGSLDA